MSTTTSTPIQTHVGELKRQIVGFALSQGFSVALWRLPNQQKINLLVAKSKRMLDEVTIEELKSGFVMAPFSPTGSKYFLEVEHLFEFTNDLSELTHRQFAAQVEKSDFKGLPKFHATKSTALETTSD